MLSRFSIEVSNGILSTRLFVRKAEPLQVAPSNCESGLVMVVVYVRKIGTFFEDKICSEASNRKHRRYNVRRNCEYGRSLRMAAQI